MDIRMSRVVSGRTYHGAAALNGTLMARAGRREVPLPAFVVELLRAHGRDYPPGALDLVFTARTAEPLKRGTFRAWVWKPSLQRASLPTTLRFHDLRHSYATWLVSDGVPINDVARVMGHEQTSTTLDRYTHANRDRNARRLSPTFRCLRSCRVSQTWIRSLRLKAPDLVLPASGWRDLNPRPLRPERMTLLDQPARQPHLNCTEGPQPSVAVRGYAARLSLSLSLSRTATG